MEIIIYQGQASSKTFSRSQVDTMNESGRSLVETMNEMMQSAAQKYSKTVHVYRSAENNKLQRKKGAQY